MHRLHVRGPLLGLAGHKFPFKAYHLCPAGQNYVYEVDTSVNIRNGLKVILCQ